jgi:signal transduction histidine kinase
MLMARVLVVDDDPAVRETLADLLGLAGHDVVMASDGPRALAQAARSLPDVILLDVMMPGMSGLEVLAKLRSEEAFEGVPVIMVSALADMRARVSGLAAGADDYLAKPFDTAELIARVQSAVRQRRLLQALSDARADTARLNRELVRSEEELRAEASADIHDTILQTLVALRFWLEQTAADEGLPDDTREQAATMLAEVDESLAMGRRIIRGLRPPLRPAGGLPALLRAEASELTAASDLDVDFVMPDRLEGLTPEAETMLFRMVREAVLNVMRHARARHLEIVLAARDGVVAARVSDDGRGFDPAELAGPRHAGHFGLAGMLVRAETVGGSVSVDSAPGAGTTVSIELPRKVA